MLSPLLLRGKNEGGKCWEPAIRAQFEGTNVVVSALTAHGKDIKEMKEDIRDISGHLDGVDRRFDCLECKVDERFDQIIALLSQRGE
jgi:hypothetical protein